MIDADDPNNGAGTADLIIFFDGECPICSFEMSKLKRRSAASRVHFVDYRTQDILPWPVKFEELDQQIHAITADGRVIKAIDVFIELYSLMGLKLIAGVLKIKVLRPLWDLGYLLFAKNRKVLGRLFQWAFFSRNQPSKD
jgi:predicted DCC family thiol-disulfide oxidoreductase YuxK